MTDPVTDLGEIVVVGQRRSSPSDPFPERPEPATGPVNPNDATVDEGDQGFEDPCADPQKALEWNADAAVAAGAKEFARQAAARNPPEDLNTREWGAYLYRNADGSVRLGPINFGPEFRLGGNGTVTLIEDGLPSDIIGSVHSHNSGGHLPSSGNENAPGDIQHLDGLIAYSGNPSALLYIVAPNQGPAGHVPYNQINVYNQSSARSARDTATPGPEVNPEGMPCTAS